jgi:hypothetical protein
MSAWNDFPPWGKGLLVGAPALLLLVCCGCIGWWGIGAYRSRATQKQEEQREQDARQEEERRLEAARQTFVGTWVCRELGQIGHLTLTRRHMSDGTLSGTTVEVPVGEGPTITKKVSGTWRLVAPDALEMTTIYEDGTSRLHKLHLSFPSNDVMIFRDRDPDTYPTHWRRAQP